jgi:RNA polymerase sporulation-specific sigma factor
LETILKAKQGDASAMNDICTEYKGLVKSIASKFYLVGGDNEDLLQEGMIGLFKAVGNYDPNKGAFPSFVKICVLRQIIGVVKRANDNKNRSLINYVELSQIHDLAQIGGSPLDVLIEKEDEERFYKTITEKLSPLEKEAFLLFYIGYGYDEVCQELGKSYKSVDGAIQRARKKLQLAGGKI